MEGRGTWGQRVGRHCWEEGKSSESVLQAEERAMWRSQKLGGGWRSRRCIGAEEGVGLGRGKVWERRRGGAFEPEVAVDFTPRKLSGRRPRVLGWL